MTNSINQFYNSNNQIKLLTESETNELYKIQYQLLHGFLHQTSEVKNERNKMLSAITEIIGKQMFLKNEADIARRLSKKNSMY